MMRRMMLVAAIAASSVGVANATPNAVPGPQIAITFDDVPAHGPLPPGVSRLEVANRIIAALHAQDVPAFGFYNGGFGVGDPDSPRVVAAWRAAGFPLGNHSFSHRNLADTGLVAFEADVAHNQSLLQRANGTTDWHWFRYPFLSEGKDPTQRDGFRAWLRARGYRVAAVTMSFDDYAWNEPYARCAAHGDTSAIGHLEQSYITAAREDARRARILSLETYGRDVPYILLMHLGAFDAHMLPRLLAMYRAEGFDFVPLAQAEKDPFYRKAIDLALPGPSPSLAAAAAAAGKPVPPVAHSTDELTTICR